MAITEEEWYSALLEATQNAEDGAVLMTDIAAALGVCVATARTHMRRAVASGRIRVTPTKKTVTDLGGRIMRVPTYRIEAVKETVILARPK